MSVECKFIPLNFHWVAIHPEPRGVVYFIGGTFFGSFPNIFYNYLLGKLFEQGYTIIAIPYRFTFRHWSVAIEMVRDLANVRRSIYEEARFLGYKTNIEIYQEKPTDEKPNYFWVGHSLGCKYISLLEILTELDVKNLDIDRTSLSSILGGCVKQGEYQSIIKALASIDDIETVSLKNQPSVFIAPVIAGIDNAIPFPPLAQLSKILGIDVEPTVEETQCLISKNMLFNLLALIAFERDRRAKETVKWFTENLVKKIKGFVTLENRSHLSLLGWKNGDEKIAKTLIDYVEKLASQI